MIKFGHQWRPAGEAFEVFFRVLRSVTQQGWQRGESARWASTLRPFGPAGYVVFVHSPLSPGAGWNVHGHGFAFLGGDVDPVEFGRAVAVATRSETLTVAAELDGWYPAEDDGEPRGVLLVTGHDFDGNPIVEYHGLDNPDHPDNPGSRFHDEWQQIKQTAPPGWMNTRPDRRPTPEQALGMWRPWMDPTPTGRDSWDRGDLLWSAAVESWDLARAGAGPHPKGFDPIRDLGGLMLVGSRQAACYYRELALASKGYPRCWTSKTLTNRYPLPAGFDGLAMPKEGGHEVFLTNAVYDAIGPEGQVDIGLMLRDARFSDALEVIQRVAPGAEMVANPGAADPGKSRLIQFANQ